MKWRKWVDEVFVHTLSPNIYRTAAESLQAMEYITKVGNFTKFEQTLIYYSGAVAMYLIGKRLKHRFELFFFLYIGPFCCTFNLLACLYLIK